MVGSLGQRPEGERDEEETCHAARSWLHAGDGPDVHGLRPGEQNDVSFAQVHVGKFSVGTFTLVCTDRWGNRFVKQGNLGRNGTRSFFPENLFNIRRPDCTLGVHAVNFQVNRRAAGSVLLIS